MRPRLIITIMFIAEFFLVAMALSPGLGLSKKTVIAGSEWQQNPTLENRKTLDTARGWDKRRQYTVYTLCVVNPIALIIYGVIAASRRRFQAPTGAAI
jgi:hypothetical protein